MRRLRHRLDRALAGLIPAKDQPQNGRFARSISADQPNSLTRSYAEEHAFKDQAVVVPLSNLFESNNAYRCCHA